MEADPSPTAAATHRLVAERTSPAANIPGTLVSKRNRSRSRGHPLTPFLDFHKLCYLQVIKTTGNIDRSVGVMFVDLGELLY